MKSLSFIHIADLHLDTAFASIAHENKEQLAKRMQDAPFEALQNLLQLCRTLSPNFLIISGDMYNDEEASLRARFALRDAFEELQKMNIPVYYAHGNHDPLNDEAKTEFASIAWPQNVYTFGENWDYFSFPPHDTSQSDNSEYKELARIYGISHTSKQESRNLASLLKTDSATCVKIGVLHTNIVSGHKKNKSKDNYAPCTIADLQEKGMHYWALGHVHTANILTEKPLVVYSGSMQGLHINEEGAHGCMFIEFKNVEDTHISNPDYSFHTLAPVEWYALDIELKPKKDANDPENIMEIQNLIADSIASYINDIQHGAECTDLIFRIKLHGRSDLANLLQDKDAQTDLCQALEDINTVPRIFIKDIKSLVRPTFDFESALERNDILGEILRVTQDLRSHEDLLIKTEKEAADLLKSKVSRYTSNINNKNTLEAKVVSSGLEALTYKSEEICIEVFEPQQ